MGLALLVKPSAPKKTVKLAIPDPNGTSKTIIDTVVQVGTDSEKVYEYQHAELKKYTDNKNKYKDNMQKCFTIIYGQYSPDIEQFLKLEKTFDTPKTNYNSIGLIRLIEKLCYNYHAHE